MTLIPAPEIRARSMSSEDPQSTLRFAGSHYKSHDGPVHGRRVPRTCYRGPRSKPCSRRGRRGALCQGPPTTAAGIRPSRRGCTTVPTRRVCDGSPCSRAQFPDRRRAGTSTESPRARPPVDMHEFSRATGSIVRFVPVRAKSGGRSGVLAGHV